jgi:hypothetical protein
MKKNKKNRNTKAFRKKIKLKKSKENLTNIIFNIIKNASSLRGRFQ